MIDCAPERAHDAVAERGLRVDVGDDREAPADVEPRDELGLLPVERGLDRDRARVAREQLAGLGIGIADPRAAAASGSAAGIEDRLELRPQRALARRERADRTRPSRP